MKERGMIFNSDMVRALLEDRKTQTRRPVKPQPEMTANSGFSWNGALYGAGSSDRETNRNFAHVACPHGKPGDRIWVRETFSLLGNEDACPVDWDDNIVSDKKDAARIYKASCWQKPNNYGLWSIPDSDMQFDGAWTPSIHMPRWASRILLEITDVRVERLQDISDRDALCEGLHQLPASGRYCLQPGMQYFGMASHSAKEVYSWLWESIYGEESWLSNPWVWVIEFQKVSAS